MLGFAGADGEGPTDKDGGGWGGEEAAVRRPPPPIPDAIIPPACEEVSGLFSPQLRPMNGDVVGRLCLR